MAKQRLSLEVPDILNKCIIRVVDTSIYDPIFPVECPKLEITPPGFWQPSVFTDLDPGFTLNATACDLGIQSTNCATTMNDLVDGIYIIRWSVSPNDIVFVEYNHLRITTILTKYQKLLCCLDIANCDPPVEVQKRIQELGFIRTLIDAAKAKVEFCHNPKQGMAIYNYACTRLERLACLCNCNC
jgi:hypothetical protein